MIVKTDGIQLNDFYVNPVLLDNHESDCDDVLGTWSDIQKIGTELHMTPIFDEADEDSLKIKGKFDRGLIKGASVGLSILDYEVDKDGVYVITNSVLNEVSLTPQPANKATIMLSYNNKTINMAKVKSKKEFELFLNSESPIEIPEVEPVVEEEVKPVIDEVKLSLNNELELSLKSLNEKLNEKDQLILSLMGEVETFKNKEKIDFIKLSIKEGRFSVEQESTLLKLDLSLVKELAEGAKFSIKPSVNLLDTIVKEGIEKDLDLSNKDNWTLLQWREKDYKGLVKIQETNEELYNKIKNNK